MEVSGVLSGILREMIEIESTRVNELRETVAVTAEFRVDQFYNVYDKSGMFFCKYFLLSAGEKRLVRSNPASAL